MVERVTIQNSDHQVTLQEASDMQDAIQEVTETTDVELAGEEAETERPEWLPEKFKSVEDMAAAYKELEKANSTPEETPEGDPETETPEASTEEVEEAVEAAGLDMEALSSEWDTEGELTQESYDKLAAVGITPEMVAMYAAGVEAQTSATQAEMLEPLGGDRAAYDEMVSWASNALSDAEIDAFNGVLETGNTPAIKLAVAELAAKHGDANGVEPVNLLQGAPSAGGSSVYGSTADLMTDMSNPEYARNPAFRAKVAAKLDRSSIL